MRKLKYFVYKITFPNGKIYVGNDIGEPGHSLRYFGSWHNETVGSDFSGHELRDFTVRKQKLFESDDKSLVSSKESEFIRALGSNGPEIGYNRSHRTLSRR